MVNQEEEEDEEEEEEENYGKVKGRFLDLHLYFTAALNKTDMRAVGLQLAMDLLYQKVTTSSETYNIYNNEQNMK